ncbi:hypothetical protein AB4Y45_40810 [Paraburkholderia sp. EG287A]|uniref:hypothetical protein n=1 Tax=unclassified Paraburkholderia TaxID=2615204 RepID=UPI0034D333DE
MREQTFARKLWLWLLPGLVRLTSIEGLDARLLRQVHRTIAVQVAGNPGTQVPPVLTFPRRIAGNRSRRWNRL